MFQSGASSEIFWLNSSHFLKKENKLDEKISFERRKHCFLLSRKSRDEAVGPVSLWGQPKGMPGAGGSQDILLHVMKPLLHGF